MSEVVQDTKTFTILLDYAPTTFSFEILNQVALETVGVREGQNVEVELKITNTGTEDIEVCCVLFEGEGISGAVIDRLRDGCAENNPLVEWIDIAPNSHILTKNIGVVDGFMAKNMPGSDRIVTVQVKAKPKGWW